MPASLEGSTNPLSARARDRLAHGREELRRRLQAGESGRAIVRATSALVDEIVVGLFESIAAELGSSSPVALAAIGGYGRKELALHSDVDLLLLHDGPEGAIAPLAERFFTSLWDARLEVGATTRTPAESEAIAAEDHTARTALLDCRFLAGDAALYDEFERRVLGDLTQKQVDELVVAKTEELQRRRERFGGTVHLLEPNVKQSPGALRDLQAALWMARARFKAAGLSDLLVRGVLPPREIDRLKEARDFLWRVRNHLHTLAGRKEDHLTFHWQEEVALAMGYRDRPPEGLAVELFMRDYYLAASAIRRLADELADRCAPPRPSPPPPNRPIGDGLKLWQGRLTLDGKGALERDPSLFVRIFTTAEALDVEIYPFARDLVREESARIDDSIRQDPRVVEALVFALTRLGRGEWLRLMHRENVLGALLPEFGRVTAKHQHDLYHVYTVDVHSVFAMQRLARLRSGELADEEPRLTLVAREIVRPLALSLGVLFHDAGKGMGGNHSEKGAELVASVCRRLGVPTRDADDAVFLVREHLAMSHVSQRRDLSDPELIDDFARRMGDRRRLDLLYVLTYVDIASVGPGTWNEWKANLLDELHRKTAASLEGAFGKKSEASEVRRALVGRGYGEARIDAFVQRMPRRFFAWLEPERAAAALRLLERGEGRTLVGSLQGEDDHSLAMITAADRPGLLASIAGVFAAHRIDVLRADVFSSADGRAVDVFSVRGPRGGPVERGRWRAARRDLLRVLEGEVEAGEILARSLRRGGLPPRHVPPVPTRVKIDNRASRRFTVVDVSAQDRRGLLHAITDGLRRASLSIAVARIATEGHRAIDSFYVTDAAGAKILDAERTQQLESLLRDAVDALPITVA